MGHNGKTTTRLEVGSVVQVSEVGYHPKQSKVAVIELDRSAGTSSLSSWFVSALTPPRL